MNGFGFSIPKAIIEISRDEEMYRLRVLTQPVRIDVEINHGVLVLMRGALTYETACSIPLDLINSNFTITLEVDELCASLGVSLDSDEHIMRFEIDKDEVLASIAEALK